MSKYLMRISELFLKPIKPKPPMTPAQSRIAGLQQRVKQDRERLQQERQQQRQQREAERLRKQRQTG